MLLEQKVPASYLVLEDVVSHVAAERRQKGVDPVLSAQDYKTVVSNEMLNKFQRSFRDWAELHQATLFLHDNGTLESQLPFFFLFYFPLAYIIFCFVRFLFI